MTAALNTPFSDLDKQRFNAWFEHDCRLPDLAEELDTTVLELAQWARQPHIAEALDAVATIARQRHTTLRAEAQHAATARLLRIVRFCDHDEIARRAADRLLRSLPAGERPLYDEPEHLTDKPLHAPQSSSKPTQPRATVPPLRLTPLDIPAPRTPVPSPKPVQSTQASPHTHSPADQPSTPPASAPSLDQLVTAVLAAADRSGIDPEDLDAPGFLEDLLEELRVDDDIDLAQLQEAINEAILDREAEAFKATPARANAPP